MKSYGVTIQMKPRQQYFHMVLIIFKFFTKWNLEFVLNFDFRLSWEWKG